MKKRTEPDGIRVVEHLSTDLEDQPMLSRYLIAASVVALCTAAPAFADDSQPATDQMTTGSTSGAISSDQDNGGMQPNPGNESTQLSESKDLTSDAQDKGGMVPNPGNQDSQLSGDKVLTPDANDNGGMVPNPGNSDSQ